MAQRAVLLVNLGSPDSTSVPDVRRYLDEFLSDDRVLDKPKLLQQFVLRCFILPRRPQASAHAYRTIWQPGGSPLLVIITVKPVALSTFCSSRMTFGSSSASRMRASVSVVFRGMRLTILP